MGKKTKLQYEFVFNAQITTIIEAKTLETKSAIAKFLNCNVLLNNA